MIYIYIYHSHFLSGLVRSSVSHQNGYKYVKVVKRIPAIARFLRNSRGWLSQAFEVQSVTRSIVGAYIPQPLGAMGYPWPSTGPGRLATSREMLGFRKCFGRRQAFVVVVELAVIWKFGSLVQNPKLPELKKNLCLILAMSTSASFWGPVLGPRSVTSESLGGCGVLVVEFYFITCEGTENLKKHQ